MDPAPAGTLLQGVHDVDGMQWEPVQVVHAQSRARSAHRVGVTVMRRVRASSLGAQSHSSAASGSSLSLGHSADDTSVGAASPASPCGSLHFALPYADMRHPGRSELAMDMLRRKMAELAGQQDADEQAHSGGDGAESKTAAVTAAMLTFVMAMLSSPLATCIPVTHLHLSRLPIGAGHSSIIGALKREWPGRDFDVRLHVYQKTRHVSGVAAVAPGLLPEDLELLRNRTDKYYIPLADSGEKMVAEESKRDRDPKLFAKYKSMVLSGLGHAGGLTELTPMTLPPVAESPVVYIRIVADRMQSNELLGTISDIKEDGLVYLLQRYPLPVDGPWTFEDGEGTGTLADLVRLVAFDKSTARQHMHRSHFGRAFFIECLDAAAAGAVIRAVQRDSVQAVDGMMFAIHAEAKKPSAPRDPARGAAEGLMLFEQDQEKRSAAIAQFMAARSAVASLQHVDCSCEIPAAHTVAAHSIFNFKKQGKGKGCVPKPRRAADSTCDDAESVVFTDCGTEAGTECSTMHQPYDEGYGFPMVGAFLGAAALWAAGGAKRGSRQVLPQDPQEPESSPMSAQNSEDSLPSSPESPAAAGNCTPPLLAQGAAAEGAGQWPADSWTRPSRLGCLGAGRRLNALAPAFVPGNVCA